MDSDSLMSMKVGELKNICRKDKDLYRGFSNFTKKADLVKFIVSKEVVSEDRVDEVEDAPIQLQYEEAEYELGNVMYSMFTETEEKVNKLFLSRPTQKEIDEKIVTIKNKKMYDCKFNVHDDEGMGNMYSMYKHNYYKKFKKLENEMILFHGTDKANLQDILDDGFSLTISVKHGTLYGKGVYFTNDIEKALSYSERGNNKKYVIMCSVHVGDSILGNAHMDVHPKMPSRVSDTDKRYDTSVDNLKNPIQFIKKNNYTYNILGVLEFNYKKKEVLNSSLSLINKTKHTITTYWVPYGVSLTDPDIIKKSKFMNSIKPGNQCNNISTMIGHKFICTFRNDTQETLIYQYITIGKKGKNDLTLV